MKREHGAVYENDSLAETGKKYASRADKVKELTDQLEQGVKAVFQSDQYRKYLTCMSKLHQYSVGNSILIMMQKPDASMIAGYTSWEKNFGRHVNAGEKAIRILAPAPYKKEIEEKNPDTGETEKKEVTLTAFRPAFVFDVSQTFGDPIPSLGPDELKGNVDHYQDLYEAIRRTSSVPVSEGAMSNPNVKGYFDPGGKKIVIREGMDPLQTVKTALHELAHSELHTVEKMLEQYKDVHQRETEAESVAYVVSRALGLDTSEYSFPYLAVWSTGKAVKELKASLETIRQTSDRLIGKIEAHLREIAVEHKEEKIDQLAAGINDYMLETDQHSYDDAVDSLSEGYERVRETLRVHPETVIEWIGGNDDEKAKRLVNRITTDFAAVIAANAAVKATEKTEISGPTMRL